MSVILLEMTPTLYMIVERFKNKDAVAVYRRFRDRGRMIPEGLMETRDPRLLDQWIANWP